MSHQPTPVMTPIMVPGPDHPITIERNPNRVVVSAGGPVVADTREALTLHEAGYPGGERSVNAVWTYETPYAAVAVIRDHLAFDPTRVDAIEERPSAATSAADHPITQGRT